MTTTSQDQDTNQIDRQQVLAELEESLLQRPDLDASDRDTMLRHFETALQDPSAMAANGTMGPDRNTWIETLDLLQQQQVIASSDRDALVRGFDEAMQVVQTDAVKLAAGFAAKGGNQALDPEAWLRRRAEAGAQPQAPAVSAAIPPTLAATFDARKRR